MELNILSITFFSLAFILAGIAVYTQQKKIKILNQELDALKAPNLELFGRGKFSELGLMSAGIAHEISNPLTIISARITKLLRIHRDPEKQKEVAEGLQQIIYNTERIERTIKGMRSFFYQDDQQFDEDISLKEVIDNVLIFCGQRFKNHGIDLRIDRIEGVHLRGFKGQIEQAILNLFNNSFDAVDSLDEKWIYVSTINHSDSKFVQIVFKDSGQGIPPEISKKMTDPFFTTKKSKGTGLGLTLVKSIAENHGGGLTYVSNASNTTFLLELPKAELNTSLGTSFGPLTLKSRSYGPTSQASPI